MTTAVETPGGTVPASDAVDTPDGYIRAYGSGRLIRANSRAAALELNLLCYRAIRAAERAAAARGRLAGTKAAVWAELDRLQALRSLVVFLPLLADLYEQHGMPTSESSDRMRGQNLSALVSTDTGQVLRRFPTPDAWRQWGQEINRDAFSGAIQTPAPETLGAAPLVVWALIGVGALLQVAIVSMIAWSIGRVVSYATLELEVIESRLNCTDRWAEEYQATGDEFALQMVRQCHEESVELAKTRTSLGAGLSGLGKGAGLVAAALVLFAVLRR